jgi:hypothetical protein
MLVSAFSAAMRLALAILCMALLIACSGASRNSTAAAAMVDESTLPAFPGAQGWAAHTSGGRGGRLLRVTSLKASGPGSLLEAIDSPGGRIIVFEIGGVIDLERRSIDITEPFVTIAGQTAPPPGVTLIRGGLRIGTHDVVIQHLRVRPGEAGSEKRSGWEIDALSTAGGAHDVIIDHCSLSWGTDETLSAAGPRFQGDSPDEWRRNTSHRITFSSNIVAETLANATHSGGRHSRGMLIHDNVTDVLIIGNLFAHNAGRNPAFKDGSRGSVLNNLIHNPGSRVVSYVLLAAEWANRPYEKGRMDVIGNVLRAGPSSAPYLEFFSYGGSGDLDLYMSDNIAFDPTGNSQQATVRSTPEAKQLTLVARMSYPLDVPLLASSTVEDWVLRNAGARPWDRDDIDERIIASVIDRKGAIIDSEQDVGGYPVNAGNRRSFEPSCWDMRFMIPVDRWTAATRAGCGFQIQSPE